MKVPHKVRSIAPGVREVTDRRQSVPGWHVSFLLALLIGTAGGALSSFLGLPLAWMLGAMTACGAAAVLRIPIDAPKSARPPMSALIGTMLGTQFHTGTIGAIFQWWPALIGLAAFLVCGASLTYLYLVRVVRLDPVTAYFCAMPGGLTDMVLMGADRGGDEQTIALVHSSRIFLVVLSLPAILAFATHTNISGGGRTFHPISALSLADVLWFAGVMAGGVWVGRLIRLPAPFLIGPMLCSAVLHGMEVTAFVVPTLLLAGAQVVLGVTIGCRFADTSPRRILYILLVSAGSTAILMLVSLLFALGLNVTLGLDIVSVLLAYAPGGLAEMSLVALALDVEVAFVVVSHIARIAEVIFGAVVFLRIVNRNRSGPSAP